MKLQWLYDVPSELREKIYEGLFASMSVDFVSNRENVPVKMTRTTPLNLFLSAKQIKEEAEPIFWRLASFTYRYWEPPQDQIPCVEYILPASHHFRYVQSLVIDGNLSSRNVEELIKLVIDPRKVGTEKHMQVLKINNHMNRIYGTSPSSHLTRS